MASNDELKVKITELVATLGMETPDIADASNAELAKKVKELKGEVANRAAEEEVPKPKVVLAVSPPGVYVRKGRSITAPGNRIIGEGEPVTEKDLAAEHVKVLIEKKILEVRQ